MASIRQRDGSWVADIRRKGHKSISKSFKTKAQAVVWAREIEGQIDAMKFNDKRGLASITLKELIDRYISEIGGIKPFRFTKTAALKNWSKLFGELTLDKITSDFLISYAHGRAKVVKGATINVELSHLGGCFRVANELWKIPIDTSVTTKAVSSLKYIGVNHKSAHRDRRPTQKEIDDICLHFTTKVRQKVPMEPLILFAIETAMRLGEIINLRWEDINHNDKTILIRDRKHPTEKNGNDQIVPLLGDAYSIIMKMPRTPDEPRIFPITSGTPSALFPRACQALGIADLRFHDLRHEGISRLFERGLTIEQVAMVSGHTDWKSLKRYVQLRPKDLHKIFEKGHSKLSP